MVLKAEEDIRRSSLPRMALEMLLLRLTQLPRLESLEEVLAKLSSLEYRLATGPGSCPAEGAATTVARRPPGAQVPAARPQPVEHPCPRALSAAATRFATAGGTAGAGGPE